MTATLVGLTLVITGHAIVGERGLLTLLDAREEVRAAQSSIRTLRYENARLRARAAELRRDSRIVEEVARRELGLIQEGELLFILSESSGPAPAAGTENPATDLDLGVR